MASGNTLLLFTPFNYEPPSAAFATLDHRNLHPVLDFDDTTDESAIFSAVMPQNYAGTTGITVLIHYSMSTATSGNIDYEVSLERIGDQQLDVDADSFFTANDVGSTAVPGTSGFVDVVSVTFTDGVDMDSVAAGELFRLKITKKDGAATAAAGDTEVHAIEIRET